jgi:signal transduction histidine kinase
MDLGTSNEKLGDLRQTLGRIKTDQLPGEAGREIRLALEQLDDLERRIQVDNEKRYKFISLVAHELRLPMTSIMGYTDLLRKGVVGPVNDQQITFLNIIRNSVERMAALVADLSDLNKMETAKFKLVVAELSLNACLEEVVHNLQPKFSEKKQILGVEIPANLPDVYADRIRVVKVVTNLLNNACMYTPEGGRVDLITRLEDQQVRVEVSDTGIGISPEDQTHLFQQFFRSEDAKVREQQGWGLGLSVVKGLVELMGGEVGAESRPGIGSTFWFTLPTAAAHE